MEEALQSLALEVGEARNADAVLGRIVRGLAGLENVALARVWLIGAGDICETCRMRSECPERSRCLQLAASAGTPLASPEDWSRLNGDFSRIPIGVRKVGEIGGTGASILITESLAESRWIARPDWARREGIAAFAGQPLVFRGEILGVLAVFCRTEISSSTFKWLRIFADHAAIAISNAKAFDEVNRLRRALESERDYLREEVREAMAFGEIIGRSAALSDVLEQVALVAPTDATVLILGESGTGKELIASALHERSLRRKGPLVRVNCGSIPAELFESEFFGHARGSFTGALRDRDGRFQLADGGTLFLDEIGEIPLALQAKLLRVLQDGQFERIGEEKTRKVNVRVVAATNRDLAGQAESGGFRRDLYYRLNVFPIKLPALRERKEDIPPLAAHFIRLSCARLNRAPIELTQDDLNSLLSYDWPGNVRELQNVIERAIILGPRGRLRLDTGLTRTQEAQTLRTPAPDEAASPAMPRRQIIRTDELVRLERDNIVAALEHARWKVSGAGSAAELLGMNPNTLSSRMRALGIKRSRT
jgi:transcriptional regulator with GAF, ATPase, and Fis domain